MNENSPSYSRGVRRVVVTGGSGVLGSQICAALAARGDDVAVLDVQEPRELPDGASFHRVDLVAAGTYEHLMEGASAVVHTASLHGLHLPHYSPDTFFSNNVRATLNVLGGAVRERVPRVVFTSSTSVYGASRYAGTGAAAWLRESSPLHHQDIYDASKIVGESLCRSFADAGPRIVALRTARFFFDDYVSYNVRKLFRGVDVRDAARAHVLAVDESAPEPFAIYNVASKSPFLPTDCAQLFNDAPSVIERYFPGVRDAFGQRGWPLPDRIDRVYDIRKAEDELRYEPQYNFSDFMGEVCAC